MRTQEDFDDETMLDDVQVKNSDLADLKKYFTMSPLDQFKNLKEKEQLFKCREHYQTHATGLPIFLKSVQWHRPI